MLERLDFESVVGVAGLGEAEGLRRLDELIERHLVQEEASGREEEEEPSYTLAPPTRLRTRKGQVAYTEMGHAGGCCCTAGLLRCWRRVVPLLLRSWRVMHAGGLAEQAFRYGAAGDGAVEVFSVKDAIEHYERARDLLTEARTGSRQLTEPSVPDLEHLYIQLGRAYELLEEWDKAREAYEAMLALAREVEEAWLEVGALNNLAVLAFHQESDPPRARRLLEDARRVAEEAGLEELLVEIERHLADVMNYGAGEFEHSGRSRPEGSGLRSDLRRASRPDRAGTGDAGTTGAV